MKKNIFTVFVFLLAGSLTTLAAMGGAEDHSSSGEAEKDSGIITLVDQNGDTVTIPANVERVVLTALPLPSIFALTGADPDMIVGMHPGSKSAIANSVMNDMYPGLADRETGFIEGTDINIEELFMLQPDLVIYWGAYSNQRKMLQEAGIPAIGVGTQGGGDALLTLETWLELMGTALDRSSETGRVIEYGRAAQAEIDEVLQGLDDSDKPSTMILFNHDSKTIVVPGEGHYGNWWINTTGGRNVSEEVKVTAQVDMEQIYQWNPEILFISSFSATMPEDILENSIPGQDWSQVEAVKRGQVYKIPLGVYRWYPPSGDAPLMLKWMALHQHPDLFDYDMLEEITSFYKEFYGYDLSEDQAMSILKPVREAAEGTITSGAQSR